MINERIACEKVSSCFRCPIEYNSDRCDKETVKLIEKTGPKFYEKKEKPIVFKEPTGFHALEDEGCSCHVIAPCAFCQQLSERI